MSESKMVGATLQSLFQTDQSKIPQELIELSTNLAIQSRTKVTDLKPDEEAARVVICCQLAIEKLNQKLSLPKVKNNKAPVPPKVYKSLLHIFRAALMNGSPSKGSPSKSSPNKSSPRRHVDTAPREFDVVPDSGRTPTKSVRSFREETPTPSVSRAETPVKSKKGTRGGPKSTDPKASDIVYICQTLKLSPAVAESITHGYSQYCDLVKDRWGLLGGLVAVLAVKSYPRQLSDFELNDFYEKVLELMDKISEQQLEEWILWSDRIVSDQTWVRRITASRPDVQTFKKRKYSSGIGNMVSLQLFDYVYTF